MKVKEKLAGIAKGWARFKPRPRLLWWLILIVLVLSCFGMAASVWMSGSRDTKEALLEGRRFLVTIENSAIQGRQISIAEKEAPLPETPAPAAAETPAAEAAPAETPVEKPAEAPAAMAVPVEGETPVVTAAVAETLAPVLPLDLAEPDEVKPAEVPLADIKTLLSEKTASGSIPAIGPDDEKPWKAYAKPFKRKDSRPIIAIVITGVGQNKSVTNAAIKLPENVTLSFNPYGAQASAWANAARTAGHEVMMDLPLEPSNYPASDPGPSGLIVAKGTRENASRLQWLMSRFQGYTGFTIAQDEVFTLDTESFTWLLQSLGKRGLLLAIGHEPAKTETKQLIENTKTAHLMVDVFLDEDLNAASIQARFAALQQKANKNGSAIGMAQALPITIQQLAQLTAKMDKDGYALVPLSFIATVKSK